MSKVKITRVDADTIFRADMELKTITWRERTIPSDTRGIFDVEISDNCTVSYMTSNNGINPIYPIVLLLNGRRFGFKRKEYNQIIGT